MLGNKKFKTIIIHTAHEGVDRDYIYELLEPLTFGYVQRYFENVIGSPDKSFLCFETTQGICSFRTYAVTGFELDDPV